MRQRSYVFSNSGDAPLPIESIEISGSDAERFGLKRTLPPVLPAGASLAVPVAFLSDTEGTFAADVIVTSLAPSSGTYSFGIQAETDATLASATISTITGYQPSDGENNPSEAQGTATAPLNFGETGTLSFTVENTSSSVPIHSITVSLSGEDADAFSVITPPTTPLAPGAATTVEIQAMPDASGTFNATVRFDLNPVADMPLTFAVQSTVIQDRIRFYEGTILDEEGNEVTVRDYLGGAEGLIGSPMLRIERSGSGAGEASVEVVVDLDAGYSSPAQEDDFIFTPQTLHWADGEVGIKELAIEILNDSVPESTETIRIYLRNPAGNVGPIPEDTYFSLYIYNDDVVKVIAETFFSSWIPFDLNGKCLVLRPNGRGDYHQFLKNGISSFPNGQAGATVISSSGQPIAYGESYELSLPAGFTIPYFGIHYSTLFIGGNGSITLGEDQPLSGTYFDYTRLFDPLYNPVPRIALYLNSSLRPENGGSISYEVIETEGEERLVVSYLNIPHVSGGILANAQLEILKSGELRLYWLDSTTTDSDFTAIGISPGAVPGAEGIDLSGLPVLMDYDLWAGGINWNGADSSRNGDPNGNQLSNYEEFVYGLPDPVNGTQSILQSYQSGVDVEGDYMVYSYRRNARSWGIRYVDQYSFDLDEWHDIDPASEDYRVTPVPGSDQEDVTLILRNMGDTLFQRTKIVPE
jgi:hypothetical protein